MGRGGRGGGNLFGGTEPEDEVPGLEDLIRGVGKPRRRRSRPISPLRTVLRADRPVTGRRGWLWFRLVLFTTILVFGLLAMIVGVSQAAEGYAAAGTLAAAPRCPAGTDLFDTDADCVGDMTLISDIGAYSVGDEDTVELVVPAAEAKDYLDYVWPTFPGDAPFDKAVGDSGDAPVRAEFWQGDIVELTAGSGAGEITVTTDANPNDKGGNGLGGALMGLAFAELAILLLIGVRAIRYRWLRPGLGLRLSVLTLSVSCVTVFIAGVCLILQPARILATAIIAPTVAAAVLLMLGLLVYSTWTKQGYRGLRSY